MHYKQDQMTLKPSYTKVEVKYYFLVIFGPQKLSLVVWERWNIFLHFFTLYNLQSPTTVELCIFICFDFTKQNSTIPILLHVPLAKQSGNNFLEAQTILYN